jgi:hypothetical protein
VGWDGWLPPGRPERWKVPRVCDWLERSGGREVGGVLFLWAAVSVFRAERLLSNRANTYHLREDVVRSVWTFGQTYEHFQNFLSTCFTCGILTFYLDGILIDSLSLLAATQPVVRCHCHSLTALNYWDLSQPQPSQRRNGRTTRPTSALSNVLLLQDFDPEDPRDR